ncbi:MAG: flavin-containing monooxygenase [Chitinophagales bacterium]
MNNKVCIIGAGSSGIATAKVFQDYGIAYDCFEKGSSIGGMWQYDNDNGLSSAYKSLHINTSKGKMSYSDYPMPNHFPEYPHHSHIIKYFNDYVDHFDFRQNITFNTSVEKVNTNDDGTYEVQLSNGKSHTYKTVIVANGHHWQPNVVSFPGNFNGEITHTHYYRSPEHFVNKKVLVVGIGNSAVDIACEISKLSKHTYLSTRNGAHIFPKYVLGKPLDTYNSALGASLPLFIQRSLFKILLYLTRGKQESYGVKTPKFNISQAHPTISENFLNLVGHGAIKIKDNIKQLAGDSVIFEDDSQVSFDHIICATGYNVSFPFFDQNFLPFRDNDIRLYHKIASPDLPNLYFIGLIQPLGAMMPLAELQSKYIAQILTGKVTLPNPATMKKSIDKDKKAMEKRYISSKRHTLQVDFYPYQKQLLKAMR